MGAGGRKGEMKHVAAECNNCSVDICRDIFNDMLTQHMFRMQGQQRLKKCRQYANALDGFLASLCVLSCQTSCISLCRTFTAELKKSRTASEHTCCHLYSLLQSDLTYMKLF